MDFRNSGPKSLLHLLLPASRRHGYRLQPHLLDRPAPAARNLQARDIAGRLRRAADVIREASERRNEARDRFAELKGHEGDQNTRHSDDVSVVRRVWSKGVELVGQADQNTRHSDGHVLHLLVPVLSRIRHSSFLSVVRLSRSCRVGDNVL